ncbi:MAG: FAD-dependent oxidoreductase [Deltaproteobacteria bacterium]|nr:FAD-dependent oxidoreductase [Deltaproteobacteria bacterium]
MIARTPEQFAKSGVDVKLNTRVEGIDIKEGRVLLSGGEKMPYDNLVMGTGSEAFMPLIPGVDLPGVFKLKSLVDANGIKNYIRDNPCRRALIVGAGFIAMEMSETMKQMGMETAVVYRGDRPVRHWDAGFSQMVREELEKHEVSFITRTEPVAVERQEGKKALRLLTNNGALDADIILFALGVQPQTRLAAEIGLNLGRTGAIAVDAFQRTSQERIYAVGDCCEVFNRVSGRWTYTPLGDVANKQGRVAGVNIGGKTLSFPGIVGAQAFKVFTLDVASTGLSEDEASACGFEPVGETIEGTPIARSLSRGEQLKIRMIADRKTGKLLGAQAAGVKGAVNRINTLSACMWQDMTIDDVGYLDLAYAPPYGGAWDPIHICAQSLRRKL